MVNKINNENFCLLTGKNSNIESTPVSVKVRGKDYMYYGEDNLYPQGLYDLYKNCSNLQGIIDTIVAYTMGDGLKTNHTTFINKKNETLSDVIEKVIFDYIVYGGYVINIIKSVTGEITEIYHQDFKRFRINEEETLSFIAKDWAKWGKKNVVIPIYEMGANVSSSIFYYKGKRTIETYPIPMWNAAIKGASNLVEVDNYHLSSLRNDFGPSVMLSFTEGKPEIEAQEEIEDSINKKWSGSTNAGKLLLTFSDTPETAPKLTPIGQEDWGDRYQSLIDSSRESLYTSFRIPSVLVGGSTQSTGFNAIEFKSAFVLYNKTVISPIQKQLETTFKAILPELEIEFIEFDTSGFDNKTI